MHFVKYLFFLVFFVTVSQIKSDGLLSHIHDAIFNRVGVICPHSVSLFEGSKDVIFSLHNKNTPWNGVDITKTRGAGVLIPNAPIKFLIHGFLNSENSPMIKTIERAYLSRPEDYNVIAVDWSKGSGTRPSNYYNCLITSRIVPDVGKTVAAFIKDLVEQQRVNILYVNVIGHSLGAQIAGRAGKKLIEWGLKLPIIVGLDPALPEFQYNSVDERLNATDAIYVEVIHTNPGELGFLTPLGTADYYPNYKRLQHKKIQPMCASHTCSHAMSYEYFAESVRNPTAYEAYKCKSFMELVNGQCIKSGALKAYMGGPDMRFGKNAGVFEVDANHPTVLNF